MEPFLFSPSSAADMAQYPVDAAPADAASLDAERTPEGRASAVSIYRLTVQFGDCDPANIVFYPNYYRWFDAATHRLCTGVGLDWISLRDQYGVVGMPLVDTGARFRQPASFGDHLEIESSVIECARKTLRLRHLVRRGDTLLVEGFEVRVLGARHPDDPKRLRALEIPEKIRNALTRREDSDRTR